MRYVPKIWFVPANPADALDESTRMEIEAKISSGEATPEMFVDLAKDIFDSWEGAGVALQAWMKECLG